MHHEAELAVVIGRMARKISPEEHTRLLAELYLLLAEGGGLPRGWLEARIASVVPAPTSAVEPTAGKRNEPRVPFGTLIETGLITFYSPRGDIVRTIDLRLADNSQRRAA